MVEEGLAILFSLKLITGEGGEKENRTLLTALSSGLSSVGDSVFFETDALTVSAVWRYMKNSNLI